ncbi:UDP-N-acetylglucosamine 2-epimerase [Lysinibacillus capsici]|uniref:UDP-N-acetylglucosamine 2-epimerase n=1 Tax=Lysinibacillus capsici TaxID=2115968 RepID=UPI002E241ABD|nr:UDP-N-acetylglucosamine 2-epimerase [Lysinibacillus capsici]
MKRNICIVTGTRAEYGLLSLLMKKIQYEDAFQLQLVVTGMHLSPEFGNTYKQIEADGFTIDEKVEMLLSADSNKSVLKSMGLAIISLTDVFDRLKPDLIIILGDRFEMLAVAQTALIMQIPIAHLHGGECTFGAYDEAIRHSITKMSTWHFTSTDTHRRRVIQLGEHPNRVWDVGAIGIENILNLNLLSKEELFKQLKINNMKKIFLITYHPETNGEEGGINTLLNALEKYPDVNLVFTKANADNGGRYINDQITKFIQVHNNAYLFDSLGQLRYLSTVKNSEIVIGNSSSALIEVPYLETPSVNIGKRQEGRARPNSVIDSDCTVVDIINSIETALAFNKPFERIFGNGDTSSKIIQILMGISDFKIQKEFYDL